MGLQKPANSTEPEPDVVERQSCQRGSGAESVAGSAE